MSEDIEIAVEVRRETDKALLVFDGKVETWVPKSKISDQSESNDGTIETIFIPEWLALDKGLI
jgi:hypothetical protein